MHVKSQPVGGDLQLSLACPQCGAAGWVELARLHNGLRCGQCQCNFLLGSNGRLLREAELPHVRFSCPRCKQSGRIPAMFALRKVHCGCCKLTLKVGPDRQLHGEAEATQMRRDAARADSQLKQNLWSNRIMPLFLDDGGRLRRANASLAVIVLLGVLVAGARQSASFLRIRPSAGRDDSPTPVWPAIGERRRITWKTMTSRG